jgi:hypothetical protein
LITIGSRDRVSISGGLGETRNDMHDNATHSENAAANWSAPRLVHLSSAGSSLGGNLLEKGEDYYFQGPNQEIRGRGPS